MGSQTDTIPASSPSFPPDSLPDASSPRLVLAHPTPAERARTWSLTHPLWGPALSRADYLAREAYLATVPLARRGGLTHWILTVAGLEPDRRPVLSSCETLRKRAVYAPASGNGDGDGDDQVREGVAYGVASVFTDPAFRGKGYASRMLSELARKLRRGKTGGKGPVNGDGEGEGEDGAGELEDSLFSVLYSDIGKTFYARHGWMPFPSTHVSFKPRSRPAQSSGGDGDGNGGGGGQQEEEKEEEAAAVARTIGYHELAELCSVDERLVRAELARRARAAGRTQAALLPELDAMLWHLMREDFMTQRIFGRTPAVRGAVAGEPGRRVWAVWTRGYYGGLRRTDGNTLHVLRVVVEDETRPDEELAAGLRAVVRTAQAEAAEWNTPEVHVWNPPPRLRGLVEKCGVEHEFVVRDKNSIASLMWHGEEPTVDVDWVANEKFAWC